MLVVWSEDGNYDPQCLESVYHDLKVRNCFFIKVDISDYYFSNGLSII